jgi:transcriptional regulator
MYIPRAFEQTDPAALHDLIRAHPFGTLVVPSPSGLEVNHLPFVLHPDGGAAGSLRAHVARGNPVWRVVEQAREAVVIFQGPHHYVSPTWYPSKAETGGKVVPTWNYAVVHAHGPARAMDDRDWLAHHLAELVAIHEAGRDPAWRLHDAPADFVEKMIGAVVGIEISIQRLVGKWKLNQNRSPADRASVATALEGLGAEGAGTAALMKGHAE